MLGLASRPRGGRRLAGPPTSCDLQTQSSETKHPKTREEKQKTSHRSLSAQNR